jgi:hypothetical protein
MERQVCQFQFVSMEGVTPGVTPRDRAKTVQKVHLLEHQRSVIRAKADSLKPHKLM